MSTREMPVTVWLPQQLSVFNGEEGADGGDVFEEWLEQLEYRPKVG